MAYLSDLGAGAATFPGFVTTAWGAVCTSITISTPIAYNATASKQGMLKDNMRPSTATGLRFCAGTKPSVNKHKYTGGGAGWYPLCSLARPTAYTKATKVSGGSMSVVASAGFVSGRFWFDAYDSAGLRQASAGPVTVASPTATPGAMVGVMPTTMAVTVPVGGYLVARISCSGATARLYFGPSGGLAFPAGVTRTFHWNPTETAVSTAAVGGSVENRENFYDSQGNPLPDGTKVYEYDASTMAFTGNIGIIGQVTGAGTSQGATTAFAGGTTGATGIVANAASTNLATSNGTYTFTVVTNLANLDMVVTKGAGTPQTLPSVNLTPTGLTLTDGGLVFDVAGTLTAGTGGSFTWAGSGISDAAVSPANTGVGEVVFTRANSDTAEYFYVVPDPASGNRWGASSTYAVGDKVNPGGISKLYAQIQSITTGISSTTEPVWPITKDATIIDGGVTWIMVEVETICTNSLTGYQLGKWVVGMTAAMATPTTPATRVAPAGAGHYALVSSLPGSNGTVTTFAAGTTGATAITVDVTSPVAIASNGTYTFTSNVAGDLVVTDYNLVSQTFLSAAVAAGAMTLTSTGLIFNVTGTLVLGTGGTFTVDGAALIVSSVPTIGGVVAGTTGITSIVVNAANVASASNNGTYSFVTNANGDLIVTKGAGAAQTFLAANLAAGNLLITDGALAIDIVGTVVANGTGGSFSVGNGAAATTGPVEPVWPTTIVSGTTTVADGNVVWTMYNNEVYV